MLPWSIIIGIIFFTLFGPWGLLAYFLLWMMWGLFTDAIRPLPPPRGIDWNAFGNKKE